jgi:hypothetical protein
VKWKDAYPLFSKDERYLNLLGTPGSNPLELFWDVVDILDEALENHAYLVDKTLAAKGIKFTSEWSEDEFVEVVKDDTSLSQLSEKQLRNVYQHVSAMVTHDISHAYLLLSSLSTQVTSMLRTKRGESKENSVTCKMISVMH